MAETNTTQDLNKIMVLAYGASDIGKHRQENQDNFYMDGKYRHQPSREESYEDDNFKMVLPATESQVYAVFDGLGGEIGGAESSQIACDVMEKMQDAITGAPEDKLYDVFCDFASEANRLICRELGSYVESKGGTTFVALQISDGKIHPFYLGDSRIYLSYEDALYLVSEDHTIATLKIKMGEMTEEEARMSPENHILTHFLGDQPGVSHIDVARAQTLNIQPGMVMLLCSDGLHDLVPPSVILEIMRESEDPAVDLVKVALAIGGYDNVTPVVLRFVAVEEDGDDGE